ncbi:MAG: peptidase [Sphingobacteriaceae bacterium]|nr:MAG: peptidase [Sphingobacteriaceae bacterium]
METNSKPQKRAVKKAKPEWEKRTASFSRWLHIYLSMFSFIIVLFFSITGITLNHAEWFDGKQVEKNMEGKVPLAWVNSTDTSKIKKLEIVELIRKNYNIKGYVSDFLISDNECSVAFKGPGYSADAFINRQDGKFQLTEIKLGLAAVFNDLHKGRDSGSEWKWLIDISAIFLTVVSLSGLVMLLFLKKKRLSGLVVGVLGGVLTYLIYIIWVA